MHLSPQECIRKERIDLDLRELGLKRSLAEVKLARDKLSARCNHERLEHHGNGRICYLCGVLVNSCGNVEKEK